MQARQLLLVVCNLIIKVTVQ